MPFYFFMKKYKHLFFDWDNTLWDLSTNMRIALAEIYRLYSLDKYFTDFEQFFGLYYSRNTELWELYPKGLITRTEMNRERFLFPLRQVGIDDGEFALKLNDDFLQICASQTNLCAGVKETFDYLCKKYNLYVISNGYSKIQQIKIECSGLKPYLKQVFVSDIVGYYKPDRRIFEHSLKYVNARKTESVMIGDNFDSDIVGAKAFGIDQIYVSLEQNADLPFEPTMTIKSINELTNIL